MSSFRNILNPPVMGIDISDFSVEICALHKKRGKPKIASYRREILKSGIVEDGKVLKKDALASVLKSAMEKTKPKKMVSKMCLVSLPSSRVLTHYFYLPKSIGHTNVRKTLMHNFSKSLPLKIESVYFDFQIIQKDKHDFTILFAAVRKPIVHQYLEVFAKAGLLPLAFDIEPLNVYRSLRVFSTEQKIVIIDIGARTTNVSIFDNGYLFSSITINTAGNDFTKAIQKEMKLDTNEAEKIKKNVGLDPKKEGGKVFVALIPPLDSMTSEVKRFLHANGINRQSRYRVFMVGGGALMNEVNGYMSAVLEKNVETGDPLASVNTRGSEIQKDRGPLFANVLGLALRGCSMDPNSTGLNLLSQARYKKR